MGSALDHLIAKNFAPVLMGRKSGALLPCPPGSTWAPRRIARVTGGILSALTAGRRGGSALVFVYNRPLLDRTLRETGAAALLAGLGYPPDSLDEKLRRLMARLEASMGFPHEVGLFLGYPAEDVAGFIQNRGKNYKLCGVWKVYGDATRAGALFEEYDRCRRQLMAFVASGRRISELPVCQRGPGGTAGMRPSASPLPRTCALSGDVPHTGPECGVPP